MCVYKEMSESCSQKKGRRKAEKNAVYSFQKLFYTTIYFILHTAKLCLFTVYNTILYYIILYIYIYIHNIYK